MDLLLQKFMGVMFIYAIISCIIGPLFGYYIGGRNLRSAGFGFVCGSLISIILWFTVGIKMFIKH